MSSPLSPVPPTQGPPSRRRCGDRASLSGNKGPQTLDAQVRRWTAYTRTGLNTRRRSNDQRRWKHLWCQSSRCDPRPCLGCSSTCRRPSNICRWQLMNWARPCRPELSSRPPLPVISRTLFCTPLIVLTRIIMSNATVARALGRRWTSQAGLRMRSHLSDPAG